MGSLNVYDCIIEAGRSKNLVHVCICTKWMISRNLLSYSLLSLQVVASEIWSHSRFSNIDLGLRNNGLVVKVLDSQSMPLEF